MILQQQPTSTSCGPACVAMFADVPVADVLCLLPSVRTISRSLRQRRERTNVGELKRLLATYGLTLGPRVRRDCGIPVQGTFLLRAEREGTNWHWAVLHYGRVFDPAFSIIFQFGDWAHGPVSWYRITRRDEAKP